MLVKRYKIEGYDDYIHRYGYFCHTELFVEKYHMIIRINGNKVLFVKHSSKPNNIYSFESFENEEHPMEDVEVDNIIIDSCYELLNKQKELENMKEQINNSFDFSKIVSNEEISKIWMEEANYSYRINDFDKAVELYNSIVKFTTLQDYKSTSLYNIGCCYNRLNNTKMAIEYLKKAYDNEFYDWVHLLTDDDLKNFKEESHPEYLQLIKKMIEKNHHNLDKFNNYYKNYNKLHPILSYLKDNNIEFSKYFICLNES
jgi:tetratricopeptide (TPR) repeat protein